MKRVALTILAAALVWAGFNTVSYCDASKVRELVDLYKGSTDIQRRQIQEEYKYKVMDLEGVVKNVEEWDKYDERINKRGRYYRVFTAPRTTGKGNIYIVTIFYKDLSKVENLKEGEVIEAKGTLLSIVDNLTEITLSFYGQDLTDEDKQMFGDTPMTE